MSTRRNPAAWVAIICAVSVLAITGLKCIKYEPPAPPKFRPGDLIRYVDSGKPGIVTEVWSDRTVRVKYFDDLGERQYDDAEEFELERVKP